jgi:hypothetical protein
VVPQLARKYGIEVTQSAWLGEKAAINEQEVEALIRLANANPDTVKRVIVGNEVLLRKDLTPQELIGYIRRVKAAVKQPVSYADVWAFWLKYPEVAKEVDFVTIHILPYWEDEPVGIDGAAEHLVRIYKMIQQAFPGKPILIGEAGWPTRGRSRGPAVASMENGARYVRTLAKVSKQHGFDYNVVEAFDQPWKARMEGTVGANWGVVDSDRKVKFAMSGAVEPSPNWRWHAGLSVVLGALGALAFLRRPQRYRVAAIFAVAALAQVLAGLAVWQAINAIAISYSVLGIIWAVLRIVPHAVLAVLVFRAAGESLRNASSAWPSRWAEALVPFYGIMAVASSTLVLIDGRYRDIPSLEFLVPCVGVTAFALVRMALLKLPLLEAFAVGRLFAGKRPGFFGPARKIAIGLLLAAPMGPIFDVIELLRGDDFIKAHPVFADQVPLLLLGLVQNREMLGWSAMTLILSLPFWAEWKLQKKTSYQ